MDLMQVESLYGKRYDFVCVDDFSRYTWVKFIKEKLDSSKVYRALCCQLQKEQDKEIICISQ